MEKYNPQEREMRGVYYTPDAVVNFLIKSVNMELTKKFLELLMKCTK